MTRQITQMIVASEGAKLDSAVTLEVSNRRYFKVVDQLAGRFPDCRIVFVVVIARRLEGEISTEDPTPQALFTLWDTFVL